MFFVLSRVWDKERILTVPMRNRTSDLRITRSNILPLSHRDSAVSVVYFEVLVRFSLVCMIVRSLTFISFSLSYWLNLATLRNLPSQSPCGTNASLTCQRRCPYITQASYIILGCLTYFPFLFALLRYLDLD